MTKTEFLGALQNLMNNFVFGHVLTRIAATVDLSYLRHEIVHFGSPRSNATVKLDVLFADVSSLSQKPIMVAEFLGSLRRAAVAEFFECMKTYCHSSNQRQVLESAPWYGFVRVIRNTTSHKRGGHISWPPEFKKRGVTSVEWNHLKLDESMEGQVLILFDSDILLLLGDLTGFCEKELR